MHPKNEQNRSSTLGPRFANDLEILYIVFINYKILVEVNVLRYNTVSHFVNVLRRISSLRRNHSQRVSKYSLARRTISCHRMLINIGLASLSNRDS